MKKVMTGNSMFFVLLLKADDSDAYQIVETCTGKAPVVFSACTLEACMGWLHAEGGSTWQSQKWNILYLIITLGLDAVWDFQAALQQQTGLTAYKTLVDQGHSLEPFDYTRRFLKGWSYGILEWTQCAFEQELDQARYFREALSDTKGKGFLPRQHQKQRAQKQRTRKKRAIAASSHPCSLPAHTFKSRCQRETTTPSQLCSLTTRPQSASRPDSSDS